MNKLEQLREGEWVGHSHTRTFIREATTGPERLRIAVPAGSLDPVLLLLALLDEPLTLLYVLHTPRSGSLPGRYQSMELSQREVVTLLNEFEEYLTSDGRHDLWIRSSSALLVWDRHDLLYCYGDLTAAEAELRTSGYTEGIVQIPSPHSHNYHSAFDAAESSFMTAYEWSRSDLRPEDEQ